MRRFHLVNRIFLLGSLDTGIVAGFTLKNNLSGNDLQRTSVHKIICVPPKSAVLTL